MKETPAQEAVRARCVKRAIAGYMANAIEPDSFAYYWNKTVAEVRRMAADYAEATWSDYMQPGELDQYYGEEVAR